jgi:hypothetical protein
MADGGAIGYKPVRDRGENSQECVGGFSMRMPSRFDDIRKSTR